MHRFFLPAVERSGPGDSFFLPDALAHQVRDVLHLAIGEQLVLLDNSGDELLSLVTSSSRSAVEVQVSERRQGKRESPLRIILCQGLLKSARFEWILEKGTELGVAAFAPMFCQRSASGLEEAGPAKIRRWQRIIQEATEQCGRARCPELLPIRPFKQVLNEIPPGALAIMAWEEEHQRSLHDVLQTVQVNTASDETQALTIVLYIGPEGGLTLDEIKLAQEHNVHVVTLGTRILRAETAALVAIANVIYELESSAMMGF